jgi:two-component system, LytTR family, sensor kinase
MDVALGVVLGMVLAASLAAGWRLIRPQRVLDPGGAAMQSAVHAATTILPHMRRGLTADSAASALPPLRTLTGAEAVALAGRDALLAFDGPGDDHHRGGDALDTLVPARREERVHVEPRLACAEPGCPLRSAIVAPLTVRGARIGALVALYERPGRVRLEESRVVAEAAALVSAMVELSELEAQDERLARAELRALRAQISPHFIYNALAAVAAFIHSRPEEARELLIEFSDFIRYAFARQRPYVTLADELQYVEKYLRLEQARFGERLRVRVQVDPEVLHAVVPVLSLQPLVENAVRHGVESRAEGGQVSIEGRDLGSDVELRVSDDGAGIDEHRAAEALAGRGPGIGLGNVHGRLQNTFGEGYGLMVENGDGTTVVMTLPKFRAGVRAG